MKIYVSPCEFSTEVAGTIIITKVMSNTTGRNDRVEKKVAVSALLTIITEAMTAVLIQPTNLHISGHAEFISRCNIQLEMMFMKHYIPKPLLVKKGP